MVSGGMRRLLWIVVALAFGLLTEPVCVHAQLVLDRPNLRLRSGQVIELFLPRQDGGQEVEIESVLFDEQSVPFDLLPPRSPEEAIRVRIRVPAGIKPGGHQISALFSETTRATAPRVVGLTLEEARRTLQQQGFALDAGGFNAEPSDVLTFVVARQTPGAGQSVRPGTRVRVQVSTVTEVPDIAGLPLEEARALLEPRGLELDTGSVSIDAPESAVRVVRYQPLAGATIAAGTRITVQEISVGVPELAGRRIEVARQLLIDSGFVPLVTVHEATDGPPEVVLGQRPAADEPAPPGTEVRLAIESRPDPPGPRWPVPEAAAVAGLTFALRRVRTRRTIRKKYKIEAHNDLDRLRDQSQAEDLEDRELGLDLRLVGFPDPGRQTLDVDGPLVLEEAG